MNIKTLLNEILNIITKELQTKMVEFKRLIIKLKRHGD